MGAEKLPIQETATLVKATLLAVAIAAVIFVTTVLPAEFNIDPTGIGNVLGLTALASAGAEAEAAIPDLTNIEGFREDETTITIPANNGLEYKFLLPQYGKLVYSWSSEETELYFDLHGEPQGDTTGYFESYAAATINEMQGSITAPFTGSHGWYWQNSSNEDVVVTLQTEGAYEIIGLK